jgi:antitoxin VapB
MSVELTSPKVDALARELAAATGEDIATAVERAIEERLARLPSQAGVQGSADLDAIFDRLAAMPVLDPRPPDEIIGFDRNGMPL